MNVILMGCNVDPAGFHRDSMFILRLQDRNVGSLCSSIAAANRESLALPTSKRLLFDFHFAADRACLYVKVHLAIGLGEYGNLIRALLRLELKKEQHTQRTSSNWCGKQRVSRTTIGAWTKPQTDWRRTQSRANLSLATNSLLTGKSTGNFADPFETFGNNYRRDSILGKERRFQEHSEQEKIRE